MKTLKPRRLFYHGPTAGPHDLYGTSPTSLGGEPCLPVLVIPLTTEAAEALATRLARYTHYAQNPYPISRELWSNLSSADRSYCVNRARRALAAIGIKAPKPRRKGKS